MLLRGVSKQVVVVRDTGSDYFDEAIFIINPSHSASERDLATEAQRIVAAMQGRQPRPRRRWSRWLWPAAGASALLLALGYALAQLV